jgi:GNAT superfamily N-acetyltransferase
MPYREATYADLAPASQIIARAFKNDAFQGRYLHPQLDKYPDSLENLYLRRLRSKWASASPEFVPLVSYKLASDGKTEECVTGFACWVRRRSTPLPVSWSTWAWTTPVSYWNFVHEKLWPDRAADPEHMKMLDRSYPYFKHHWTGSRAETWYLDLIGVDPTFEGQGFGRELVAYGFQRAKEDGVGTSLIAAEGRDRFYRASGFDVQMGIAGDEGPDEELRRELRSIGGGMIHFWDGGKEPVGVKKYGEE